MTGYEIMLLTRTDLEDGARTAVVERAREAVTTQGGTWGEVAEWGRRTTAYPIQKLSEAHYQVLNFEGDGDTVDEAVRVLRITDGVLRVIATKRVPAYPDGAREALERLSDEEFAAGPKDRGRGGRGPRGGGRGRDRD